MAFLKTIRLLARQPLKTEIILNKVLHENFSFSNVADKYVEEIRNLQINSDYKNVSEYFDFPVQTFMRMDKKSFETIVSETYDIMKGKGYIKSPSVYKTLLKCYVRNRLNFGIDKILKDMSDNRVAIDDELYSFLIKYHCNYGEMNSVEGLLKEMKSKGIDLTPKDKFVIASGYIIARQPEKAEVFSRENKLNMLSHDMFFSRCFGYACIGDVTSLKKIIVEMKKNNVTFSSSRYCNLYYRLISGNVDKTSLTEIIDMTKEYIKNASKDLFIVVSQLNSVDKFKDSIFMIEKLIDFTDENLETMKSFDTPRCPRNVFKHALIILSPKCQKFPLYLNIFSGISFDSAFEIAQNSSKSVNWKIVYFSLINKAAIEKSLSNIEKTLGLSVKKLQWNQIDLLISLILLPSMKMHGMLSNYDEILDILPGFSQQTLPIVLMHYLCRGDFDRYNELRLKQTIENIYPRFYWNHFETQLGSNLALKDIGRWSLEAQKCFHKQTICDILEKFVTNEIIKLIKNNGSPSKIVELIDYTKEWDVKFSQSNIESLFNALPERAEFIQSSIVAKLDVKKKSETKYVLAS